jgi:hypothetical protein
VPFECEFLRSLAGFSNSTGDFARVDAFEGKSSVPCRTFGAGGVKGTSLLVGHPLLTGLHLALMSGYRPSSSAR